MSVPRSAFLIAALASFALPNPVRAQQASVDSLVGRVEALERTAAKLEGRVRELEAGLIGDRPATVASKAALRRGPVAWEELATGARVRYTTTFDDVRRRTAVVTHRSADSLQLTSGRVFLRGELASLELNVGQRPRVQRAARAALGGLLSGVALGLLSPPKEGRTLWPRTRRKAVVTFGMSGVLLGGIGSLAFGSGDRWQAVTLGR